MNTLWDLLSRPRESAVSKVPQAPGVDRAKPAAMQQRYDTLVTEMKATWGIRVRRWRSRTSGCAWELRDRQGRVDRMIEAPYPRGPMSCVVFLHEVGHHAIGFNRYSPRCLEEFMAWDWALRTMQQHGFNVTDAVRKRFHNACVYALVKALRRGLRRVPEPLMPYLDEALRRSGRRIVRQMAG